MFVVVGVGVGPAGWALESEITFTTNALTGSRTTAIVAGPTFATQDLAGLTGGDFSSTAAVTTLTETVAAGANWTVTAQLCGPDDYDAPDTADCTTYPDQLIRASGTAPADSLDGSTISVARGAFVNGGLPAHSVSEGGETTMTDPIVLMTSTTENPTTVYTGAYTTSTTLTVNDLIRTGTWKGYWVVTQGV